jgi:hypothetical protein
MAIQQKYNTIQNKQNQNTIMVSCLFFLIVATIILDFIYSLFQNSSFFISESLLFSSFWLLFFPLTKLLLKLIQPNKLWQNICFTALITCFHLSIYPALIWFLSKTFYYHTFPYWQTFNFGITEYTVKSILIYGFLVSFFVYINKSQRRTMLPQEKQTLKQSFISSIITSDRNNKKIIIDVNEILYFSANSPYVNIFHLSKKYLHTETLKSLETQLDDKQFIRIHKSHIVNSDKIISIQSRKNGDYDVTLIDNTNLRMSRNYVAKFKSNFGKQHHLAIK